MECSDPAYYNERAGAHRRSTTPTTTSSATTSSRTCTYGVRVEDDDSDRSTDNEFTGDDPAQQAIVVGTRFRTPVLGQPVDGTVVTGNAATIAGNPNPYRWIHGHTNTTFDRQPQPRPRSRLLRGRAAARGPFFIFVVAFVALPSRRIRRRRSAEFPPPAPLPPCPTRVRDRRRRPEAEHRHSPARHAARRRHADVQGARSIVPHPFVPALDPVAVGVGHRSSPTRRARASSTSPFRAASTTRRRRSAGRRRRAAARWKYVDRSATPLGRHHRRHRQGPVEEDARPRAVRREGTPRGVPRGRREPAAHGPLRPRSADCGDRPVRRGRVPGPRAELPRRRPQGALPVGNAPSTRTRVTMWPRRPGGAGPGFRGGDPKDRVAPPRRPPGTEKLEQGPGVARPTDERRLP